MRRPQSPRKRLLWCVGAFTISACLLKSHGAPIDHAKITEVVNNVAVLDPEVMKAKPARADELFRAPQIMKTGAESRSEMVGDDQTITRVGANTLFSFEPRERLINLRQGSVLFQSPTGKGGGTIRTASATASVLGTTIIVATTKGGGFKLLVLEGTAQLRMPNGTHAIVHGGQMIFVPPKGKEPGPVVNFLLETEVDSGRLVYGFRRPLPSWAKIKKQIIEQEEQIAAGRLRVPGVVLGNVIDPNTRINQVQALHPFAPASPISSVAGKSAPGASAAGPTPKGNPNGGVR
jgi:hypothetical protein